MASRIGAAFKQKILSRIDDPLPLLPVRHKNQHLIGNLPRFMISDDHESEPLGDINGKPVKELIVSERELLQYVKDAYKD